MNRKFYLTTMSRALALLAALACAAVAIVPGVPAARGAGAVSIAVVGPENSGGVTPAILAQVGQAIYDGIVSSGRYDVRGGGPLKIQVGLDGDSLGAALAAASRAGADQVVVSDVLKLANGKIVYRMSIYKVSPVTFGRSQVFQQAFPPSDQRVFASQFGHDLASLEAPRTNTGTIYAVSASGILSDTGAANGFHLGQRFNVVRTGKKVAEAQISQITDVNATLQILNPSPSYQPQVGDLLISQEPGPAIPVSTDLHSGGNGALDVIALIVGAGAAILALGHHGNPATQVCPPPTPSGAGCVSPSPTGTGAGSFTVILSSVSAPNPRQPTFTFTFSKPVQGSATFNFSDTTKIYVLDQVPPAPAGPPGPLTGFAGATATAAFDGAGTTLTVTVTGALTPGHAYFINFTSAVTATDSTMLTPASFRYPSSGTVTLFATHPMPAVRAPNPSAPNGGSSGAGNNGGSNGNGNGNGSGPKAPQPVGGHEPHGGPGR